ncbi:hypothetical protein ACQKP7_17945 [Pseudomonas frederiksbergensis]|uniref:hypothetical protein n=1 Tax=Pseudomonas frederiksbergensis TaxID=104087 RepID=UPI003CFFA69D
MDSAIDRNTGQIIDGEQLWYIDPVDKNGYLCRGCGVQVNPVSFELHHKVRPHFKELPTAPHEDWCDVDGEVKLVESARKKSVTTKDGFPGSFPAKLHLVDERAIITPAGIPASGAHRTSSGGASSGTTTGKRHTQWTANTIRPICRTFMNFPHDRLLPLDVPGTYGKTYDEVVRKLASGDIVSYPKQHIFAAPLSWSKPEDSNGKLTIKLSYGFWANKNLAQPYRVIIDYTGWSDAKKNYVLAEFEVSRAEAVKLGKPGKSSPKAWVFFLGEQDAANPSDFIVKDHRLICCLTGEL